MTHRIPVGLILVGAVLDAVTTWYCISVLHGAEYAPVMHHLITLVGLGPALMLRVLVPTAFVAGILYVVRSDRFFTRVAAITTSVAGVVGLAAATHNLIGAI